jgi:hypothetical protein
VTHEEILERNKTANVALINQNKSIFAIQRAPVDPDAKKFNCYGQEIPKTVENPIVVVAGAQISDKSIIDIIEPETGAQAKSKGTDGVSVDITELSVTDKVEKWLSENSPENVTTAYILKALGVSDGSKPDQWLWAMC